MRYLGLLCVYIFVVSKLVYCQDESMAITFDTLFPETTYQKAFDICMQVWSDIEDLNQLNQNLSDETLLRIDAAVGRLLYVQLCLDHLKNDSSEGVDQDDLAYLGRILFALEQAYDEFLARFGEYERLICARHILHTVHGKVAALMNI